MDAKTKGGLIGFIITFIGLWVIIFIIGHDAGGWKCVGMEKLVYCGFFQFVFNMFHVGFVLLFSWIGFFAGKIDARIIQGIINENRGNPQAIPLRVTSTVMITAVIVFGLIGTVAFDNWVVTMIYAFVFFFFVMAITWAVGKWRYSHRRH